MESQSTPPLAQPHAGSQAPLPSQPGAAARAAADAPAAMVIDSSPAAHVAPPSEPAISTDVHALLQQFLQHPSVQQRYAASVAKYAEAAAAHAHAKEQFALFERACNKHAPALRLPKTLQLDLVKRARMPTVEGAPTFFQEVTEELRKIEADATKSIYDALCKAKKIHIAHLASRSHALQFIAAETAAYKEFLLAHAQEFNSRYGRDVFPTAQAAADFQQHLQRNVNDSVLQSVLLAQQQQTAAAARAVEESKAQEQVMAGAHNGQTIAAIARKAADSAAEKAVRPLKQQVIFLQQQRPQPTAAAAGANKPPRPPQQHAGQKRKLSSHDSNKLSHLPKKSKGGDRSHARSSTDATSSDSRPQQRSKKKTHLHPAGRVNAENASESKQKRR